MEMGGYNLDPTSSQATTAHVNELAGENTASQAARYMQDAPQARGLLSQPDTFSSGLGYGDRATSDAIRQRSGMQPFLRQENVLKADMLKGAQADKVRALQMASDAASQEVSLNHQKALLKWQIEQANKKARGAVLGNILGITGAVAGGVAGAYAGGPTGAMMGASAGMSLGQAGGNAMGGA